MANTVNSMTVYYNQYQANQTVSLFGSNNSVDLSLVGKYVKDDDLTQLSESSSSAQATKVKNSSELLDEIHSTKRDKVALSNTLSDYSALCTRGDCSRSDTTQKGAKVLLQVLSATGGKSGVEAFTDAAFSFSDSELHDIFNQAGTLSANNASIQEIADYANSLLDVANNGSKSAVSEFLGAVDTIINTDFTVQVKDAKKMQSEYKNELINKLNSSISEIVSSDSSTFSVADRLSDLFATTKESSPEDMYANIG